MTRQLIHRLRNEAGALSAREPGPTAAATRALGALAVGAVALGAFAIGALAIGKLAIGRARIRRLEIDELVVHNLHVTDELYMPPTREASSTPS